MYRKVTVNVILSSETVGASPLRSGARKRHLLLPLLFNTGISSSEIRLKREIKDIQIGRKKNKTMSKEDMIMYTENSKESAKKLLELMS